MADVLSDEVVHRHGWCEGHDPVIDQCSTAPTEPAPGIHLWLSDYGLGPELALDLIPVDLGVGIALDTHQVLALITELQRLADLMKEN